MPAHGGTAVTTDTGPPWWCVLVAVFLVTVVAPRTAAAENFVADLSDREIAISSSFKGQTLTLFGSINPVGASLTQEPAEGPLNLVVVVRGPEKPAVVRRKSRQFGIWMNTDAVTFTNVPVFFYVASYFEEVTPTLERILSRYQLTPRSLRMIPDNPALSAETLQSYKSALIRIRKENSLFVENYNSIDLKETLFRTEIAFPANVPVGVYNAEIYLIRGDSVIAQSETLYINKTGLGRSIYEFAIDHSFFYGVFAVVSAFFAGWLASVLLRRD